MEYNSSQPFVHLADFESRQRSPLRFTMAFVNRQRMFWFVCPILVIKMKTDKWTLFILIRNGFSTHTYQCLHYVFSVCYLFGFTGSGLLICLALCQYVIYDKSRYFILCTVILLWSLCTYTYFEFGNTIYFLQSVFSDGYHTQLNKILMSSTIWSSSFL